MPRKKKTEIEKIEEKRKTGKEETKAEEKTSDKKKGENSKEKTSEKEKEKEETKAEEKKAKEFPDIDLGIDIFSQVENEEESIKKETSERKNETGKEETKKDETEEELEEREEKLEELKEKAKELEKKIEKKEEVEEKLEKLREELKESKEKKKAKRSEKTLFPLDDYVKYSVHLGTKAITPYMRKFVYKRRADGLAVLNTNSTDEKLKEAIEFLVKFKPEDIFLACKREAGWKAAEKFSEVTGIKAFTKKYPAGIITNIQLADFFETELVIICDPWLDKNALNDAVRVKRPIIGLCDTNNLTTGLTKVIPCNNKAAKSIGLIFYLLAREYLKARGQEKEAKELKLEDFTGEVEETTKGKSAEEKEGREEEKKGEEEKKIEIKIGAKEGV